MPPTVQYRQQLDDTDKRYFDNVESIRASLEEIALLARYVRKWTPWLIAAIGILWPAAGHLIAQLPPLSH